MRKSRAGGRSGQTAVEYLLTTLVLMFLSVALYRALFSVLGTLYHSAGVQILASYTYSLY